MEQREVARWSGIPLKPRANDIPCVAPSMLDRPKYYAKVNLMAAARGAADRFLTGLPAPPNECVRIEDELHASRPSQNSSGGGASKPAPLPMLPRAGVLPDSGKTAFSTLFPDKVKDS